jgi:hypothetical protein
VALTSRIVSPVVAATAVIGLSLYAWRSWLRLRAETQWEADWATFQRRRLDRDV